MPFSMPQIQLFHVSYFLSFFTLSESLNLCCLRPSSHNDSDKSLVCWNNLPVMLI